MHCGACLQKIEAALGQLDGVEEARANLSARRVTVLWRGEAPPPMIPALNTIGYPAHLYDAGDDREDPALSNLLRALAVAGFAASNIMLLSVSVWSGAEARDPRPLSLDLGPDRAAGAGLFRTGVLPLGLARAAPRPDQYGCADLDRRAARLRHEPVRDHPARPPCLFRCSRLAAVLSPDRTHARSCHARARAAGGQRAGAAFARAARWSCKPDGSQIYLPVDEIEPGMTILLAAGERVPVDGRVIKGRSELDRSLVSGESAPQPATEGTALQAGILNLTGPLTIVATAAAKNSFLAEMIGMMEAAETGRSAYRRIADRAARLYAPVVHATAPARPSSAG